VSKGPRHQGLNFFEDFRNALSRLPNGLFKTAPGVSSEQLDTVSAALGGKPPEAFVDFARSWNGVQMFHETLTILSVTTAGERAVAPSVLSHNTGDDLDTFVFAISGVSDDRYAIVAPTNDEPGGIFKLDPEDEARWFMATDLATWLAGMVAHEAVLVDSEGEFVEGAFDLDDEDVTPTFALRQAERALKKAAGSAVWWYEKGSALQRLGRTEPALRAFTEATRCQPGNPWPWFQKARCASACGDNELAAAAFERAAGACQSQSTAARMWAYIARIKAEAQDEEGRSQATAQARAADSKLLKRLSAESQEAQAAGDQEGFEEAFSLAAALSETASNKPIRLAVVPRGSLKDD